MKHEVSNGNLVKMRCVWNDSEREKNKLLVNVLKTSVLLTWRLHVQKRRLNEDLQASKDVLVKGDQLSVSDKLQFFDKNEALYSSVSS